LPSHKHIATEGGNLTGFKNVVLVNARMGEERDTLRSVWLEETGVFKMGQNVKLSCIFL
jgi:hypothetical protein